MGEVIKTNEDLQKERDRCNFNIQELTTLIDGGPHKSLERKKREDMIIERLKRGGRDVLVPEDYMSYKEKYENGIRNSVELFGWARRMLEEGNMSTINNYRDFIATVLASITYADGSPLSLHYLMFLPGIMSQGNEEQQAKWLPRAWACNIIGSYAQTELGHGTFIRGLETTATYDPSTQEFVLHSPTLTSYKWWPGGVGQTVNYCIVVAQLYTQGECHGIHAFIVQIRDEDTHMPLPGIKVGEIGAKLALNSVNNGFLGFDNVRIPRTHMLMKNAAVSEDGTYVKFRDSKLSYGAMMFVRVVIVYDSVYHLSKAATIATRFSAVRRQCQMRAGEPECQILDYVTQQHKIFISIATCHALKLAANKLWDTFQTVNDEMLRGNLKRLPELHALACCLKSVSTSDTAHCVESCRLACGGHGYMHSSNLPRTYGLVTAACTFEGDNTVLLLQTARFLVKTWQNIGSDSLTPTVTYLKKASTRGFYDTRDNSAEGIIRGFEVLATRKVATCVDNIQSRLASGMTFEDAWNASSVQLVSAADAHCRVIIMSTYHEEVVNLTRTVSSELAAVLQQLVQLYTLYWALEKLSDLLLYTTISEQDVSCLRRRYEDLLQKIRPNAVGLVDAFDIRDDLLQSTLGAYDGRAYERLMEEAMKSPLNAEPVNSSFHRYLKPFMQGKL